jgi:hypothetical protein
MQEPTTAILGLSMTTEVCDSEKILEQNSSMKSTFNQHLKAFHLAFHDSSVIITLVIS